MADIGVFIRITVALLGVAYPILLQVIARLDGKYSSDGILSLFDREIEGKAFKFSLITSLLFILIWVLTHMPLVQDDLLNNKLKDSAAILLNISTIVVIVAFFFYVRKILIYYTPTKLVPYLISKHIKSKDDFKYFEALSDILLSSIKTRKRNLSLTLSDFFYSAFKLEREKHQNKPIIYPDLYYEVVYRSIEELAILQEKRNYSLEYRTAGGIWLLGELEGNEISDKTYSWLWRNLLLITQYKQEDLIVYHWETVHQFYTYSLQPIRAKYDSKTVNYQISNQKDVDKRNREREKFIEFHYALGGLLLYAEMYGSLHRIFSHTNSQPPRYELLPDSMYEIFQFYFSVRDIYDRKYVWISHKYPFPKQSGLNADFIIKKWISSYMALLFLRQYTLIPYLITMRPLDNPAIPITQTEIKEWIDGLDFFKKLILEHLNNPSLLKKLNLTFLTPEWCSENQKIYPTEFIDNFKKQLLDTYKTNALTLPLSDDKIKKFEDSTKRIIEDSLEKYDKISNSNIVGEEFDKWYINGLNTLQSKDAFSETPEVHHIDFDSFLASELARGIREGIASTFLYKKSKSYLLKPQDFFQAIDRLKVDEQYLIVCFGLDLDYFINDIGIKKLTHEKYRDLPIFCFENSRIAGSSLFIIKQDDLPKISTKTISSELIDKYSLKKISEALQLYTSVIDLNDTSEEIFSEVGQGKEDDEIKKSVLLTDITQVENLVNRQIFV